MLEDADERLDGAVVGGEVAEALDVVAVKAEGDEEVDAKPDRS